MISPTLVCWVWQAPKLAVIFGFNLLEFHVCCNNLGPDRSTTDVAEPEQHRELNDRQEEQKVVVSTRMPLVTPWSTQKNPLHGLHEKHASAETEPWHDEVV